MPTKNGNIQNVREFKSSIFEMDRAQRRLAREQMREQKEKFLYDTELIDFENIMLFTYPQGHNKDNIFHLCIKDDQNNIEYFGKKTKVPMDVLQEMDINEIEIEFFDDDGDEQNFFTNNAQEIAESEDCYGQLDDEMINFLQKNFANKTLKMLRRYEIWELDHEFVALQQGKHYGQNTFQDFEK